MSKVIFLDIDGVLNGHDFNERSQSNTIRPSCVLALNYILKNAEPKIVISSAWRYMILTKHLTTMGFEYLLRTHGVFPIVGKIIGTTRADEYCPSCKHKARMGKCAFDDNGHPKCKKCGLVANRGLQIFDWLCRNPWCDRWVVLDDLDLGFTQHSHPFVQTDQGTGLTMKDARKVVNLLR